MRVPLLLLILALQTGCVMMGRATQGALMELDKVDLLPGETTLQEVLDAHGPPQEWHRLSTGSLLIWWHRQRHYGSYGIDFGFVGYVLRLNPVVGVIVDNAKITYERVQEADVRLAVLVDRRGVLLAAGKRDGRGRLTFF